MIALYLVYRRENTRLYRIEAEVLGAVPCLFGCWETFRDAGASVLEEHENLGVGCSRVNAQITRHKLLPLR